MEEVERRRAEQLENFAKEATKAPAVPTQAAPVSRKVRPSLPGAVISRGPFLAQRVVGERSLGGTPSQVMFSPVVHARLMRRYRFRNTFTDECYIVQLEASPDDEEVQGAAALSLSPAQNSRRGRPHWAHRRV